MKTLSKKNGAMTAAIHAGEPPDLSTGASSPALHMSATFLVDHVASFSANDLADDAPYLYARWSNPNVKSLEQKLSTLEGSEDCACFASGMAAAAAMFMTFLSSGDHLIASDVTYAGVAELIRDTLPRWGIEVSLVDMSDPSNLASAMRPNTRMVHIETPANPIGRLTDIAAIAEIVHNAGGLLSADATFASPIGQESQQLGIDLTMYSLTKYISGHGDAVGGAVAGSKELVRQMRNEAAIHYGGVLSPFNAWLIARGMTTLPLRMAAHERGAMTVAKWLEQQPSVKRVIYPGLDSHPQRALAARQMKNTSGMLSFQVGATEVGEKLAAVMIEKLELIHFAASLGHQRSLIYWIGTDALMESSFRLTGAQLESYRAFAGDGVFRLSVGLEDGEDLIEDLARVL